MRFDVLKPLVSTCAALTIGVLSGCFFDPSGPGFADAAQPDAVPGPDGIPGPDGAPGPDAPPGTPDAAMVDATPGPDADRCMDDWTMTPSHFDPCAIVLPMGGGLVLDIAGTYEYDTTSGTLTDPNSDDVPHNSEVLANSPNVRLVSVDSFEIASGVTLRVTGTEPLIVASWSTILVDGDIDVSSDGTGTGAGANPATGCSLGGAGVQNDEGGSGGGGGGFGGAGGNGGIGGRTHAGEVAGGTGGVAVGTPSNVRGGCRGRGGARGDRGDGSGAGGDGGGAVQLTAAASLTINGRIHAGGAAGDGAVGDLFGGGSTRRSGGGGGGSGGMIGLEAPTLTIADTATLAANGGGGGEGCNGGGGDRGDDGVLGDTVALGGAGSKGGGGDGGDGGFLSTPAGNAVDNADRGGGGGGGGVGYIIVSSPGASIDGNATISPPETTP